MHNDLIILVLTLSHTLTTTVTTVVSPWHAGRSLRRADARPVGSCDYATLMLIGSHGGSVRDLDRCAGLLGVNLTTDLTMLTYLIRSSSDSPIARAVQAHCASSLSAQSALSES